MASSFPVIVAYYLIWLCKSGPRKSITQTLCHELPEPAYTGENFVYDCADSCHQEGSRPWLLSIDLGWSVVNLVSKLPLYLTEAISVAPLSVLSNWEKQIDDHCVSGVVSTCVYYGNTRNMSAAELQKHDIVITTYQTVTGEYEGGTTGQSKKRKAQRSLFEVSWKVWLLRVSSSIGFDCCPSESNS